MQSRKSKLDQHSGRSGHAFQDAVRSILVSVTWNLLVGSEVLIYREAKDRVLIIGEDVALREKGFTQTLDLRKSR